MHVSSREAQSILTPQRVGFLVSEPFPFTHTLSAYTGCGFGATTCGLYCYAQFMPNWQFAFADTVWGTAVQAKSNAPELLNAALQRMSSARRRRLRIFMSSTTDPYQPIEAQYQLTRRCLEVFAAYDDLDLLVIQTRSPLARPAATSFSASSGRFANTLLMRSVSAYTLAPVSVAKSMMSRGRVRLASASVSANAMRPSASV